jgi:hypothetical protein
LSSSLPLFLVHRKSGVFIVIEEMLELGPKEWDGMPNREPDCPVIDLVIVAMRDAMTKPKDVPKFINGIKYHWVVFPKPCSHFSQGNEVALDPIPYKIIFQVLIKGCIAGYVRNAQACPQATTACSIAL